MSYAGDFHGEKNRMKRTGAFIQFKAAIETLTTVGCVSCKGHNFEPPMYTEDLEP